MDGSSELLPEQRKVLLAAYRCGQDARVARRAHLVQDDVGERKA